AIAHSGSRVQASRNAALLSLNQNECSSATPRSTLACAAGSHELANDTLPSDRGPSWAHDATFKGSNAASAMARSMAFLLQDRARRLLCQNSGWENQGRTPISGDA